MSRSHCFSTVLVAAFAFASPVLAQEARVGNTGPASMAAVAAPMAVPTPFVPTLGSTVEAEAPANRFLTAVPAAMPRSQSVALMIVGGAGLIVGSVVHGDTGTIIMAGGAVVGLVGLYNYLR